MSNWKPLAIIAGLVLWLWPKLKEGRAAPPGEEAPGAPPVTTPEKYAAVDAIYQGGDIPEYQFYLNFRRYFIGDTTWSEAQARAALEEARKEGWVTYTGYLSLYDLLYA